MTRARTPSDLRERMERVAARSRPAAAKPSRRTLRPVPLEPVGGEDAQPPVEAVVLPIPTEPRARRRGAGPPRQSRAEQSRPVAQPAAEQPIPEPRTRLEALFAWGMWELTEVPAKRWQWLKAVIRSGGS